MTPAALLSSSGVRSDDLNIVMKELRNNFGGGFSPFGLRRPNAALMAAVHWLMEYVRWSAPVLKRYWPGVYSNSNSWMSALDSSQRSISGATRSLILVMAGP